MGRRQKGVKIVGIRGSRHRSVTIRGIWGAVDQALSSVSNFFIGFLVLRSATVEQFGTYSLLFTTYLLFLGTNRALLVQPFTIRLADAAGDRSRDRSAVFGGSMALALAGTLIIAGVGLSLSGDDRTAAIAFGATLPGLILQDSYRSTFFSLRRPQDAAKNDFVWTFLMALSAMTLVRYGADTVSTLLATWGGSATIAALYGWVQCRVAPNIRLAMPYVRRQRDLGLPLMGDFWTQQGARNATTYGLPIVANMATVGAYKAAAFVMGPLNLMTNALVVVALPELVRIRTHRMALFHQTVIGSSIFLAAVAATWGLVLSSVPHGVGVRLVGDSWGTIQGLIAPFAVGRAATGAYWGAVVGSRALESATGMLKTRLVATPLSIMTVLVGAAVSGASGAAIGYAIGATLSVPLWWAQYLKAKRSWSNRNEAVSSATA